MADDRDGREKGIKELVQDLIDKLRDALDGLVSPAPELVPVPVRRPRR